MLPFTLTMNKYGLGREVGEEGAEEASLMHGPRKSTCMLLSLSLLDTLDTSHVDCSMNFMELWSVDLRIWVTQYNICCNF